MKMKKKMIIVVGLSVLLLNGCAGVESEPDASLRGNSEEIICPEAESQDKPATDKEITKDVVFYNNDYSDYRNGVVISKNHMVFLYDTINDENTLYAMGVSVESTVDGTQGADKAKLVELLSAEGFYLIKDYPSDYYVVIAATREELKRVFEETKSLGNFYLRAVVVESADGKLEESSEQQVTLSVPVIPPEETEYTREVVFSHRVEWNYNDASYLHEPELNGWYDEVNDKDVLYAYAVHAHIIPDEIKARCLSEAGNTNGEVELERYIEAVECFEKEIFLKMGFVIVENHPNDSFVIAGTKEQLDTLFVKNLGEVDGWRFCALQIVRPDMDDILRQTGWTENDTRVYWFREHYEEILPLLGTDADQVVLTVPVILPEETVQTTE